jgi:alpha-beta hydrolase superfamily lysophospholipase
MAQLTSRFWRRAALVALVLVLVWFASAFAITWKLTHRTVARHPEPAPRIEWGALRELRLATVDGEDLGAWWIEAREPRAAALLLHGNDGGRGDSLSAARILVRERISCLLVTLRAHGDSSGELNDIGWSSRTDVIAGVAEIERAHPGLPVLLQGTSLGSAAAIFAGRELGTRVHGYLLEMPYSDIDTAVRNRTRMFLPPVLDWIAALGIQLTGRLILPHAGEIAPLERIGDIPASVPVLILNGGRDPRARPFEAQALLARAGEHARLVTFDDAAHEVLATTQPERYGAVVREWLARCLR